MTRGQGGTCVDARADGADREQVTRSRSRRRRPQLVWSVLTFLAFALVEVAWTVAVPLGDAPDEPAHVFRAVSLLRGTLVPPVEPGGGLPVTVPGATFAATDRSRCSQGRPNQPNHCPRDLTPPGDVSVHSSAGRYMPVYYAVVGLPTLLDPGRRGLFGARLVSGLTCAAMLAAAAACARQAGGRTALIGVAAAVTPMVTGLAATVNPSAWEISGGILFWTTTLALFGGRSVQSRPALLASLAAGGSALAITRQLSVLWVLLILGTALLACGAGALRRTLREGGGWAFGVVALACAGSLAWYLSIGSPVVSPHAHVSPLRDIVARSVTRVPNWLHESYGVLGWLDAPSPLVALCAWTAVLGILVLLAVVATRGRLRLAVIAVPVVAVLVSIAVESALYNGIGRYWWQGRYVMPYSLGLPVLCAVIVAAVLRPGADTARVIARWTLWPLTAASGLTFVAVLHRFAIGYSGPWTTLHLPWSPPGSVPGVVALYLVGMVGLTLLMLDERPGRTHPPVGADPDPVTRSEPAPGTAFPGLIPGGPLRLLAPAPPAVEPRR